MNPYMLCGGVGCFFCTWGYAAQPFDLGTLLLKLNTWFKYEIIPARGQNVCSRWFANITT